LFEGIAVSTIRRLSVLALLLLPAAQAGAQSWRKDTNEIEVINKRLSGHVVDYTANHGKDNRIWSRSLYQRRDLYVYLPPNFEPCKRYPIMLWLHGFAQDEQSFLHHVAPEIDAAICAGKVPPMIVAAPDGSLSGEPSCCAPGSFFLNSKAGAFEDFVLQDVWDFMCHHYPICHERCAHILAGVSMGGFAAYNFGIKHREAFGVVVGMFPPLNLRWVDDKGHYFSDFNPKHWGWRTKLDHGGEAIAKFYGGLMTLTMRNVLSPVFGLGPEALEQVMMENPIEMVDRYRLHEGELAMYVAYAGQDEFNIHTQVDSFLYLCKCRGLTVCVGYEPWGHHDHVTAKRLTPGIFEWLGPKLAAYSPVPFTPNAGRPNACTPEGCPPGRSTTEEWVPPVHLPRWR
jgi:hypothetical protein